MDGDAIPNNSQEGEGTNQPYIGEYKEPKTHFLFYISIGVFLLVVLIVFLFFFVGSEKISEEDLSQGATIELKENEEIEFTIEGEEHKITIESINSDSIDIIIQSEIIKANLKVGEEKKFDLDGDGIYDLKVKFNGVEDGKADISIKQISESICVENWNCDKLGECIEEKQTQICVDTNNCGTEINKPALILVDCEINITVEAVNESNVPITSCVSNDGTCPSGCTSSNDNDCTEVIELADCNDSDGGKNIYIKGITNGQEDECFILIGAGLNQYVNSCNEEGCSVDEQWCDSIKGYQATGITCDYGCSNGACLEEPLSYCNDTDGGKDYFVKGYFELNLETGGIVDVHLIFEDLCELDIDPNGNPNLLAEFFCPSNIYNLTEEISENYICPNGCSEGACIQ